MTSFTTTAAHAGFLDQFAARRADVHARFQQWKAYRQTRNELMSLSDRELNDLGLHRSGIRAVALEAAYGEA